MYSIHGYAQMISDRGRTDAYAAALRHRVKPGSVILDLGAGPGILSFLACQYGARKVYAIEADDMIQVARECAVTQQLTDRIEFIQGNSNRITLPEKVDGIVCDIHGALPVFDESLVALVDARNRFLAHQGWIIPLRETIYVAAAACADSFEKTIAIWTENSYRLDMAPARQRAVNQPHKQAGSNVALITTAERWTTLDYETLSSPNVDGRFTLEVVKADLAHGLIAWFKSELTGSIELCSGPEREERHVYGQLFFPWPEPLFLVPGDSVSVHLKATPLGSDYVWQWATTVRAADGAMKADLHQNTLSGRVIAPERLRRRGHQYVPNLNKDGKIVLKILELMDLSIPLERIAKQIASAHPDRFENWQDAMGRAGELSVQYSI